ncbi:MAG TPA: DUF4255 domain-containing protein [Verrucomicrobiae bacterium]|jgi:hypothetical protein
MSNARAIEAVTATLRHLIVNGVPDLANQNVTAKPLDRARSGDTKTDQLNLFLYQTMPNAAWGNQDLPRQVQPGETGRPPLALNLYYLVTAYGRDDEDTQSHRWLGQAMSVLHDHPLLDRGEISSALAGSGLESQLERIRITPQPLSLEEMSKLWAAFQTQYRISTAYELTVVLIESQRPARTPLPVLTRGEDDRGVDARGDLIPPFPAVNDLKLVAPVTGELLRLERRRSCRLGETLAILGHHFAGPTGDKSAVTVRVRFQTSALATPLEFVIPAASRDDERITLQIPNDPVALPAGFYQLAVLVNPVAEADRIWETNEWPLLLAPRITSALPLNVARTNVAGDFGDAAITLDCAPQVRPSQRASLALGDREVPAEAHETPTATLKFVAKKTRAGSYRLRLRVDGVDSQLLDFSDPARPMFDDNQMAILT